MAKVVKLSVICFTTTKHPSWNMAAMLILKAVKGSTLPSFYLLSLDLNEEIQTEQQPVWCIKPIIGLHKITWVCLTSANLIKVCSANSSLTLTLIGKYYNMLVRFSVTILFLNLTLHLKTGYPLGSLHAAVRHTLNNDNPHKVQNTWMQSKSNHVSEDSLSNISPGWLQSN